MTDCYPSQSLPLPKTSQKFIHVFLSNHADRQSDNPTSQLKHKCNFLQGLYRNLTVVFQTFPGQNYFFFSRLFKAFCEQDLQNWL